MKISIFLLLFISISVFSSGKSKRFLKKFNRGISKIQNLKKQKLMTDLEEVRNQGGDYLGYSSFISSYLEEWHDIKQKNYNYYSSRRERGAMNPIDLFSGGIAIRESLQLDTINRNYNAENEESDEKVLLSTLIGPEIKSHPFKKMLGNKEFKLSKLTKFAPNDFYYIHINSFTKALNLWDDLMLKLKPIYKRFETANVDYRIKDKVMLQVGLKENKALRIFYDLVVEEAAIVGSDPFIVTGSDVTVIFKIKSEDLFKSTIKKYRKEIKKEQKANMKVVDISGYKANYLFTKNRKVNSYYLKLDNKHYVLSNSKEALRKVIKTYKNKKLSLYDADEYRYMRSIYKLDKDEGIFLYLSDSFIRRLVGPEVRLKEAKRISKQFMLTKMQSLLMLYNQLYEKSPKSLKNMIKKLAPRNEEKAKKHNDLFMGFAKGLKLSKDKNTIESTEFGSLGYFKPNIENTKFNYVPKEEADRYKNFLRNYNNYWRDFFDPIGIKISTKSEKIVIDTHILPLINSSMYNEVRKAIGGTGVKLNYQKLPSEWLKISFKLTDYVKKVLPKAYKEIKREFKMPKTMNIDFSHIIGENITFSVMDSSPLVDFNTSRLFSSMLRRGSIKRGFWGLVITSLAHPLRASLDLKKDGAILEKEVDLFISHLIRNPFDRDLELNIYKKSYKNQDFNVLTINFWEMITFRVYFMFTENSLELTTTERYLTHIIDNKNISNKKAEKSRNISISFHPDSLKLEKEYFTNMLIDNLTKNNLKNIRTLRVLNSIYGKLLNQKEFYNRFGFNITYPLNQEYTFNKNEITHPSLSGYKLEKINMEKLEKEILSKYYSIKNASVEFEFTSTGIDTRIIVE